MLSSKSNIISLVVLVSCVACTLSANCPTSDPTLHATFPSTKAVACTNSTKPITGQCDLGFAEGLNPPQATCCEVKGKAEWTNAANACKASPREHSASLAPPNETPCIMLDFDTLIATDDDGTVYNMTGVPTSNVGGDCAHFEKKDKDYSLHSSIEFDMTNATATVTVTIDFVQNASYSKEDINSFIKGSGDRSAQIENLKVDTTSGKKKAHAIYTYFPHYEWAVSYNRSYSCDYDFVYTTNDTSSNSAQNATLEISNVLVQPFIPAKQSNFSLPDDSNNFYCPTADKSVSKIGMIVGGVLTGLALIGIIGFAISSRRKSADINGENDPLLS